jgi:hypothetical protein
MSSLKKYAIDETTIHHLRDASDELMYADGDDGQPDTNKPMRVKLYGPGSKIHAKAKAAANNRALDRFKKKGKSDMSAEDQAEETAKFLVACTHSMENIDDDNGLKDAAMYHSIYTDLSLCFIPQQIDKVLGDTANFFKVAPTT